MAKNPRLTPELHDMMFSLFMSGFNQDEIRKEINKLGFNYSPRTIEAASIRKHWRDRKKAIIAATEEKCNETIKASKSKHIQAWALATDALCDQIISDYMEYKQNPNCFMSDVRNGNRPKPIWMVTNSRDAAILLETQYALIGDFKKGPDTQVNIQNNSVEVQLLGDDDRKNLLKLLAEAKEKTLMGESITVEPEEPALLSEQTVKTESE